METIHIPLAELQHRIDRFAAQLREKDISACMISGITNLYYFTGTTQQGLFFIFADGTCQLMARKSYERAAAESALRGIVPLRSFREVESQLKELKGSVPERIGYEADIVPVQMYGRYQKMLPDADWVDVSLLLRKTRMAKSPLECEWIRQAGRQVEAVMAHLRGWIRPGMTELEIAAKAEYVARTAGHQGIIRMRTFNAELFYGVVSAGESANEPTNFDGPSGSSGLYPSAVHPAGRRATLPGMSLVVDFMGAYMGYLCDTTRMFFMGSPPDAARKAHQACLDIQQYVAEHLVPGMIPSRLHDDVLALASRLGVEYGFMGFGPNRVKFVAHGVGLEVDEWPVIAPGFDEPLEEGTVLAVEPKVYLPQIGGLGVENTFVVTPEGGRRMVSFPDELIVIDGSGDVS